MIQINNAKLLAVIVLKFTKKKHNQSHGNSVTVAMSFSITVIMLLDLLVKKYSKLIIMKGRILRKFRFLPMHSVNALRTVRRCIRQ